MKCLFTGSLPGRGYRFRVGPDPVPTSPVAVFRGHIKLGVAQAVVSDVKDTKLRPVLAYAPIVIDVISTPDIVSTSMGVTVQNSNYVVTHYGTLELAFLDVRPPERVII